jgi:hypothetical protein
MFGKHRRDRHGGLSAESRALAPKQEIHSYVSADKIHYVTGNMFGDNGGVVYCACGRSYFAPYPNPLERIKKDHRLRAHEEAIQAWRRRCNPGGVS